MVFPATTAFYAAIFALFYVGLSSWVIMARFADRVPHGDGGCDSGLQKRIRAHGNFIEFVPIGLILIGLLETSGASHACIQTLLIILLIARIIHPVGMFAPRNSLRQFICRGGSIIATLVVLSIAAVALLSCAI